MAICVIGYKPYNAYLFPDCFPYLLVYFTVTTQYNSNDLEHYAYLRFRVQNPWVCHTCHKCHDGRRYWKVASREAQRVLDILDRREFGS
jgi:hypothetical protein